MSPTLTSSLVPLALIGSLLLWNSFYTIPMTEQVVITQFGKVKGGTISEPGLHFKTPFIDTVNRFDKRVLEWDSRPVPMTTRDKQTLEIGTFARWRITDPLLFLVTLRDERTALSRLDTNLGSSTRGTVANHDLIELIRTEKDRKVNTAALPQGTEVAPLLAIAEGRVAIERTILKQAQPDVQKFGIEILDVRFKRLNYSSGVLEKIHARMISEREQIAQRFRSEGEGEAARIQGKKGRDLREIESEAYKKVQQIRGAADAEATRVYAEAYDKTPESREFYGFVKTLETYRSVLGSKTNLILSTDSDLFRLFKQSTK